MSGAITESLRNIELVKSLGLTYPEIKRLKAHTKKIFDLELQKVKKVRMLSFLQSSALTILKQSILFILSMADIPACIVCRRTHQHAVHIYYDLRSPAGPRQYHFILSRGGSIALSTSTN